MMDKLMNNRELTPPSGGYVRVDGELYVEFYNRYCDCDRMYCSGCASNFLYRKVASIEWLSLLRTEPIHYLSPKVEFENGGFVRDKPVGNGYVDRPTEPGIPYFSVGEQTRRAAVEAERVRLEAERAEQARKRRADANERGARERARRIEEFKRRADHAARFGNLDTAALIAALDKLVSQVRLREIVGDIFEPRGLRFSWDDESLDEEKAWVFELLRAASVKTGEMGIVQDVYAVTRYLNMLRELSVAA